MVVQNASAQDNGVVQDNNSVMEMAVPVLRARVLAIEYPVLMPDFPVGGGLPVSRQPVH